MSSPDEPHTDPGRAQKFAAGWRARSRRARASVVALCVLLTIAGVALVVTGLGGNGRPSSPAAAASPRITSSAAPPATIAETPPAPPPAAPPAYADFHLSIPKLGVESDLMDLGLNADRTIEVPPLTKDAPAGWYKYSPLPGDLGPSIILGHIDSAEYGPGVFYELSRLKAGDIVSVNRADHRVASFHVDRVEQVAKDEFPTAAIYGNTPDAQLRLITCGGTFDAATGNYEDNIIAFATLESLSPIAP